MKTIFAAIIVACTVTSAGPIAQAQNTAYGTGALSSNRTLYNAAFGVDALEETTYGAYDTAFGIYALQQNTNGEHNTATGVWALTHNTVGNNNTATGASALQTNVVGSDNTAVGADALSNNTGSQNTALGSNTLGANTTGTENTAAGYEVLYTNSTGNANTGTGEYALYGNLSGNGNTAEGHNALLNNQTGSHNTAAGENALASNLSGSYNTADGEGALSSNTAGSENLAIGHNSGENISGSANVDIANVGTSSDDGVVRIGTAGTQTSFYAAGISGVQVSGGVPVYINSNGQLGTVNSSIRFKEDVHDMADASSRLFQLRPVTYRYKQAYADGSKPVDYGLIAEEVAKVYPDMVARDSSGEILTVQYQKLTPMLLNEVQKQHRQLEAQEHAIQKLVERLSALETAMSSGGTKLAKLDK